MTKNGLDAGVFQDTFNFFNSIVNIIEFSFTIKSDTNLIRVYTMISYPGYIKNPSPLLLAYLNNKMETFKFLLEHGAKSEVVINRNSHFTIFTHAVSEYNLECLEIMLRYGTDINEGYKDYSVLACLMHSHKRGDWKPVAKFLTDNGCLLEKKQCTSTLYHFAISSNYNVKEKCRYLKSKGLDINIQDEFGRNVMFYSGVSLLECLLELGVDPKHIDKYGDNCLTCKMRHIPALLYSDEFIRKCEFFIRNGLDINHRNREGESVLSLTQRRFPQHNIIISYLVRNGAT